MAVLALKNNFPGAKGTILSGVDFYLKKYASQFGIDTPKRMAAFLAQAAHETDGFKTLREYWGPTAIQNTYGFKGGNNGPADGKKYMGRGIFQVTLKDNYRAASKKIFGDERLLQTPELLEQPEYAVLSALHYWNDRNLNRLADIGDFEGLTKKINAAKLGMAARQRYNNIFFAAISANPALFFAGFLKKKLLNTGFGRPGGGFFDYLRFFVYGR